MSTHTAQHKQGFTLLEILLVVAAIAILAGIVIVALNPAKQLGDTNNAQRQADLNTIINAVYQYSIDNGGEFPGGIDDDQNSVQVLGTGSVCDNTCGAETSDAQCLDLSDDLVPTYLVDIPSDPTSGTTTNTDYYIERDENSRITVGACDPAQGATLNVTR